MCPEGWWVVTGRGKVCAPQSPLGVRGQGSCSSLGWGGLHLSLAWRSGVPDRYQGKDLGV